MPQINCYLPIKLRIVGELSDAQLEQLGQTLVRSLRTRLAFAERTIAAHHNLVTIGGASEVREAYDPAREESESSSYRIPSYQQKGQLVSMALQTQGRPWIIRKATNFKAYVGQFLDVVENWKPMSGRELYSDLEHELRGGLSG